MADAGSRPPPVVGGRGAPVAGAVGAALARVFGLVRRVRRRPLHPRGVVLPGVLVLENPEAPGVTDLGGPGAIDVRARFSRAAGLPAPLPDNQGLALRWETAGRRHDLLLAGSGLGRLGRFALVPRRRAMTGPFSTLMPFVDARGGSLLLAAVPVRTRGASPVPPLEPAQGGGAELTILTARPAGPWTRAGTLSCPPPVGDAARPGDDPLLRFDPVLNVPGTLRVPAWAARVRLPVYRRSRA